METFDSVGDAVLRDHPGAQLVADQKTVYVNESVVPAEMEAVDELVAL